MKTITLAEPWTYLTPAVTIDYPAGTHEVDDDIAAAADNAGVTGKAAKAGKTKGTGNGDESTATTGAQGDTGAIESE